MINRELSRNLTKIATTCALVGTAILCGALTGCGGEEPQTQVTQAPPPPPPPPPAPSFTPIDQLMTRLGIDSRIEWAEENAPKDDAVRTAVLTFFDAQVRGDATSFGEMLPYVEKLELDEMVDDGTWQKTTDDIERVEITAGTSPEGEKCVLGLITVGFDYQPQLWEYRSEGADYTFEAVATPLDVMNRLSGTDWIQAWYGLLADEMELATKPDDDYNIPQTNLASDDSTQPTGGFDSPGGNPNTPGIAPPPNNPGSRRPPRGPKVPAPGPGAPGGG